MHVRDSMWAVEPPPLIVVRVVVARANRHPRILNNAVPLKPGSSSAKVSDSSIRYFFRNLTAEENGDQSVAISELR